MMRRDTINLGLWMKFGPGKPEFRFENEGLQLRAFETSRGAESVCVPGGMRLQIDEAIRFSVRCLELENFAFERRIESGCGVGRRLMNNDGRRTADRVIDHTLLAQRREWVGLLSVIHLKTEDDFARTETSIVSDGSFRRGTAVRDAGAPLLIDELVLGWHPLRITGQRL